MTPFRDPSLLDSALLMHRFGHVGEDLTYGPQYDSKSLGFAQAMKPRPVDALAD